ncbi:T9SS type A sorting domain-containing protein [Flavobacterium sp. CS20]|uniref:T9SS type A sorting domain-containing protein n=1 Tax=Flavobacterium sp. CS20 TaxID=2775246 RepID=UPI001B39D8A2|nr:T9SS type A sorting domain-containing protein [Flavobacterium sp. CS20]QTY27997.1 T9SS type A sorting domain-containing protein [Flavobacterium sp. CS20]
MSADSGAMYMLLESDIFGSCQSGVDIELPFDFDVFAGVFSTVAFSDNNFKYYPNPVSSTMTIDSANPIESVQVFDILGKEVFSNNYEETSININMDALSSGTYLMKVSISGNSQTFRVIKE